MNKLYPLAAGLMMAAISLTACGGSSPAAEASPTTMSSSPTPTPTPTATAASSQDQVRAIYLDAVRKGQPALQSAADDDLVTIGQGFCKMYAGGAVGSDINNYILTAAGMAYTVPQLISMHGSAVGAFCPEYTSKVDK